jgi:hypothetical protein
MLAECGYFEQKRLFTISQFQFHLSLLSGLIFDNPNTQPPHPAFAQKKKKKKKNQGNSRSSQVQCHHESTKLTITKNK